MRRLALLLAVTMILGAACSSSKSEEVQLQTADGLTLAGTVYGPSSSKRGVVLSHMRGADRGSWVELATLFADESIQALTFDFRGHGDSPAGSLGDITLDVEAAVRFLRERGVEDLTLIGASMGGTASAAVAQQVGARGLATISAPTSFEGIDGLSGAAAFTGETLFIAAEDDAPYAAATDEFVAARGEGTTWLLDGSAHGTDLFRDSPDLATGLFDFVRGSPPL